MKRVLSGPVAKVTIGLLIGIGLLFVVSRFVNIAATISCGATKPGDASWCYPCPAFRSRLPICILHPRHALETLPKLHQ